MESIINSINNILWSNALIALCLGTGLYFSLRTRFLQVRHLNEMVVLLAKGEKSDKGISSFQALCTSLAGRIGTGNIAGVATAIAMGGPGALFWMWAIAFLGAGSAFVESTLAQIYKEEDNGEYRGGPAYYIEKGMGVKWYAILFAVATLIAMGVFLPGVQSNSISAGIENAFGISKSISGLGIIILLGLIIFGGIKRISSSAELIVPFMGLAYILMSLVIIAVNIEKLPEVITLIFKSAFGAEQAFAGILGSTIAWGVKRGVYSNEAGQGTGPQAAAAAEVSHPAKQGFVQAFSVYVDTLFVCSATGFMLLMTDKYNVYNASNQFIVQNLPGVEVGPAFTQSAVDTLIPGFGSAFVAVALFFFAFTTLMAYYYISEVNLAYLAKRILNNNEKTKKVLINILKVVILASTYYGCVKTSTLAWTLGDIGVGVMAWINIIAILIIAKPALIALKDYEEQKKLGIPREKIDFNPIKLGIKNATFWEERLNNKK
ncbi:alanine/glycine:cation symporter family protein [Paraclostridium bifermentans]|jgi:AGCS family alanine or glycine:cation symporter|uniref:alanine/glycine:cation symporter family protein n=1 Tax=Paraclostridium bifermentans TaxID=1490 RepID=UPI000DF7810D|nr:alanine/glycine:cation symporter family protein [Paraclostridium bifermentans]MBS5954627.1 alanine:cation symporter family protein [Paraclostridium bifermentans]MBU5288205.1 alanine:cation symporter family protein [Paraclostridium bifermentans]RDC49783.1 alanine:cation symporter family protein [Acinetobacter sp. RIT592]